MLTRLVQNTLRNTCATVTFVLLAASVAAQSIPAHQPVEGKLRSVAKDGTVSDAWRTIRFSTGSFRPEPGVDHALVASVATKSLGTARSEVYAFLLTDRFLDHQTRATLESHDIHVIGPHGSAYKVRLPADLAKIDEVASLPWVEWIGLPPADLKIDRDLLAPSIQAGDRLAVWINLFEEDLDGEVGQRLLAHNVQLGRFDHDLDAYRAEVPAAVVESLAEEDAVLFIEPMRAPRTHHDASMALIGADFIRPSLGASTGDRFDGSGVSIGVMDSGFDFSHFDLENKIACDANFIDGTSVFSDPLGHGSHVLGTLGGDGTVRDELRGVAPGAGTLSHAELFLAKVFDASGNSGDGVVEQAMDFMNNGTGCVSSRPQVINFSGGTPMVDGVGTDALSRKLDALVFAGRQTYVVSSGNDGPFLGGISSPGLAKNALTVGAVEDSGFQIVGDLALSSSRGPTGDGRMKPNVLAPGSVITSVSAGSFVGYRTLAGTSMAAPHVTGLVSTLSEHHPTLFLGRPQRVRARLMASSLLHDDIIEPTTNGGDGRGGVGLGRISSIIAHDDRDEPNGWFHAEDAGFMTGSTFSITTTVPEGAERLVAVLVWDEPAASAGDAQAVTFDYDLWIDHDANGFCSDPQGDCGEFVSRTVRDNTEWIIVDDPPPGEYRIRAVPFSPSTIPLPVAISATILRGDPRPRMSLAVSGPATLPEVGESFVLTTTAASLEYVASGVFHDLIENVEDQGLRFDQLSTVRADGIGINESVTRITLGNIPAGQPRQARWTFTVLDDSPKHLTFRTWSENGGELQVVKTFGDGDSPVFTDGFESGNFSAWSLSVP